MKRLFTLRSNYIICAATAKKLINKSVRVLLYPRVLKQHLPLNPEIFNDPCNAVGELILRKSVVTEIRVAAMGRLMGKVA